MSKKYKKQPIEKRNTVEPVFQTNSVTNYAYPDGDKSHPELSDEDVDRARDWVDDNHK